MITLYNGTTTLSLRNPTLGDSETLDTKFLEKITKGGHILLTGDTLREKTFKYQFTTLKATEMSSLRSFLLASQGKQIKVTDHFNRVFWAFIILDQIEELTEHDTCSYSVTIDLLEYSVLIDSFILTDEEGVALTDEDDVVLVKESYYANI